MADKLETAAELSARLGWKEPSDEQRALNRENNLDDICDTREARMTALGFDPVSDEQRAANLHYNLICAGIY